MPMRFSLFILLFLLAWTGLKAQPLLHHGHAHNDYLHARPLEEALEAGFTSIEIDIYEKKGRLRVSHWPTVLGRKPTLEDLYLAPLRVRVDRNGGTVFPGDSTQLVLLIDLKEDANLLYRLLSAEFEPYADLLASVDDGEEGWGPLKLVLTGGPPLDLMRAETRRYFFADAALAQWASEDGPDLMLRASTKYGRHFKWKGKGPMPADEQQKLADLVALAHKHGRKIRFWAAPDNPAVWKTLLDAGVDWVNVDDLEGFAAFWETYSAGR